MAEGDCWTVLGLEGAADLISIRRAYARTLKTIDVDGDPQAFIRLRAARDAAMAWLESPDQAPEWADSAGEAEWDGPDSYEPEEADRLLMRLEELLFTLPDEPVPSEAELHEALEQLLGTPEAVRVDSADSVEEEIEAIVDAALPRSEPIVPRLVAFYAWEAGDGRWDQSPRMQRLLRAGRAAEATAKARAFYASSPPGAPESQYRHGLREELYDRETGTIRPMAACQLMIIVSAFLIGTIGLVVTFLI